MVSVSEARGAIREFFVQELAEKRANEHPAEQRAVVSLLVRASDRRATIASDLSAPPQAFARAAALRDAVWLLLGARKAAAATDVSREDALAIDGAAALAQLQAGDAGETAAWAAAEKALAAKDPLFFDELSREDAEATIQSLEGVRAWLRPRVEIRSPAFVRGLRFGRLGALILVGGYLVFRLVGFLFLPQNVALGKQVTASSRHQVSPRGNELVDGWRFAPFGIHTNREESPWVLIDLERPYEVQRVRVYNRSDTNPDDVLPLVLEFSDDGKTFYEVDRRSRPFDKWDGNGQRIKTRWVRLHLPRTGYIALSEVEVMAKR